MKYTFQLTKLMKIISPHSLVSVITTIFDFFVSFHKHFYFSFDLLSTLVLHMYFLDKLDYRT